MQVAHRTWTVAYAVFYASFAPPQFRNQRSGLADTSPCGSWRTLMLPVVEDTEDVKDKNLIDQGRFN